MGLLQRLQYLLEVQGSSLAVMRLCIRVVIACARSGPSSAWHVVNQGSLLRLLCQKALVDDTWDPACRLLVLRLLRWLSLAGRNLCENLASLGYLGQTKRFLVGTPALREPAFTEVRLRTCGVRARCP